MRGKPEQRIEVEKVYKTKMNDNGLFIARIIQIPREEEKLDFVLVVQNRKTKTFTYQKRLVTTDNHYHSFRLARGSLQWVSLYTVAVWDNLGHKLVEVSTLTGRESYRIADEHCSAYREK
ncbi:hypothetical protein ACQKJC_20160 [Priestia koreensis]|uniref:hypothetical protein n=1 Tax=Priestia koreensis TaxID=284581 RepID=UPI003D02EAD6